MSLARSRLAAAIAATLAVASPGGQAVAHHSQAMYDADKRLSLTGVVKEFAWVNPHIGLKLVVPGDDGASVEWTLEGGAVAQLRQRGWRRDSLVPGEKVTAIIHPLRSGAPGGVLTRVTRANGEVVGAPARPPTAPR